MKNFAPHQYYEFLVTLLPLRMYICYFAILHYNMQNGYKVELINELI